MGFFSSKRHGIYKNVNGKAVLQEEKTFDNLFIVEQPVSNVELVETEQPSTMKIIEPPMSVMEKDSDFASVLPVGDPVRLPEELVKEPVKKTTIAKKSVVAKKKTTSSKTKEKT